MNMRYLFIAALACICLCCPDNSNAGVCRSNVVHNQVVAVADVVVPVAVPILVPAYQFSYLPALQPAAVATAAPVETETSRIDQLIRERLEAIIREQTDGDGPPAVVEALPSLSIQSPETFTAISVLRNRCSTCHTGAGKGGVSLFNVAGAYAPNITVDKILDTSRTAQMPPAAKGDTHSVYAVSMRELAILSQLSTRR